MKKTVLTAFVLLLSLPAFAQFTVCGFAQVNGENQPGASVTLNVADSKANEKVETDNNGKFCFNNVKEGRYLLLADYDGFLSKPEIITVTEDVLDIVLEVEFMSGDLEAIQVQSKSEAKIKGEHSIKTDVVNLRTLRLASITVEESLNRAVGVRVRNSGGLGAAADILVGGVNGKSVRFLIDGIPVDYLGTSMGLTKLPAGTPSYIEIYKGVLPTEIGIDALGAAINIVTNKDEISKNRINYEIGSFNTHRFSLNSVYRYSDRLSLGVNSFVNYSDNNFKVTGLPVDDPATGRMLTVTRPMFHNGFKQFNGEIYTVLSNLKWADRLKFSVTGFAIKKELQNDFASRNRPYGEVYMQENAYAIPTVLYEKSVFGNKLDISQFLVYSSIDYKLADPLKNGYYDWYGNKHEAISGSETGIDLTHLSNREIDTHINNFTSRSLFTYHITSNQKLVLNLINNNLKRIADDLSRDNTKTDIYFNRFIAGLGYEYNLFDGRAEGLSQIKFLNSQTSGISSSGIGPPENITASNSSWSISQSLKINLFNNWMLRASLENTYRLPDQAEIFGDNVFIIPNFTIKPEKSFNINTGIRYERNSKINLEANVYYRLMQDMIRLKEITLLQAQHLNLDKVKGYGVELEGQIYFTDNLLVHGNLTYNEFRFKGSSEKFTHDSHFINARVSNMPFYFGNLGASYKFDNLIKREDNFRFYWAYSYVHQFYLDFIEKQFEPDGFLGLYGKSKVYTSRVIPMQQVHSLGAVWSLPFAKGQVFSLSTEVENLFDSPVFNNFKMQSAGRSISAKITLEF